MKKTILSQEEMSSIAAAVKKAESSTSGEISTALIQESSDYAFYELRASVFFGVLVYMIQLLFFDSISSMASSLSWNAPFWYVPVFMGGLSFVSGGLFYFFSNIPAVDRIIIPRTVMNKCVRARALQHFTESDVYSTKDGTGILIFISLMERRVELIADKGIHSKISGNEWQDIVRDLSESLSKRDLSNGLQNAVLRCGDILKAQFPVSENDVNELSDGIVILEE
ncbi:hypothetical protein EXM22_02485 [Oceanispirochaeta crateris]|uniref:TPM domain-containing protein n=1 Tax=Oceanispirochaeta crateris TaxID=2518645 RepID=A0A5C1QK68_9SPIO|nr:TPM domain-containing protein [Oceanispirochaeta crateris]QEN06916.1 hypothetical protein EXM22_02485 [Oceanispirochaeta crateris]